MVEEKDRYIKNCGEFKKIKIEDEGIIIISYLYNAGRMEEYWRLWERMDYLEDETLIIEDDFNIRIGNEGKLSSWEVKKNGKLRSRTNKDHVIGNGDKIKMVNKKGWKVANQNLKGDEGGEFTFTGTRGSTVIDHIILKEKAREEASLIEVEGRVESNHAQLNLVIRGGFRDEGGRENGTDRKQSKQEKEVLV